MDFKSSQQLPNVKVHQPTEKNITVAFHMVPLTSNYYFFHLVPNLDTEEVEFQRADAIISELSGGKTYNREP